MNNDAYRMQRIVEVGHQLLDVIEERGIDEAVLQESIEAQWLVTTPLYNIGEQANCISKETASMYPDVPWAQVAGLRHRLVHDYEGINWKVISSVVFDELPDFIKQVEGIVAEEGGEVSGNNLPEKR